MGYSKFIVLYILLGLFACGEKDSATTWSRDLEVVSVDISKARKGKMSEFLEGEVEYLWLKDDSENSQLNAGLHRITFYENLVITMDIFGCKCIQTFDRNTGEFVNKIAAYGEGPGKYVEFDDFKIVDDEIVLLGVYPYKIMWFSLKGELLREQKLDEYLGSGVFDNQAKMYYFFFPYSREPGKFDLRAVSSDFSDTLNFFPYDPQRYYGNYSARDNFFQIRDEIYLGVSIYDTIYSVSNGNITPRLLIDFGSYKQSTDEMARLEDELDGLEMMNFINKRAKFYFTSNSLYVDSTHFYSRLTYEGDPYIIYHNRLTGESHTIEGRLENDLDEGYDLYGIQYHFGGGKVGVKIPGKSLYKLLYEKKIELGEVAFNEYINGKGRNFAKTAVGAKDSENPVLIVYTMN